MNIDTLLAKISQLLNELTQVQAEMEITLKNIIPKVMANQMTVDEIIHEYDIYAGKSDAVSDRVERMVKLILFNPYVAYGRCNLDELLSEMDSALKDIAERRMKAKLAREEMTRLMMGMQMKGI